MINEVFDEEVDDTEEEFDQMFEVGEPVEIIPTHPFGVFKRTLAGRDVWFHGMSPSQFAALRRLHETTQRAIGKAKKNDVAKIVFDFNNSSLTLVEGLILDDADTVFLRDAMLLGDLETEELLAILWPEKQEADDDADPEPVKTRKATPARVSKVANGRRTKKK